jgi:2-polyprenyl-3-methyl-5-hydroxy-6-metoxy-1,4-benzoquinol methylase
MKKENIELITRKLGIIDASRFIALLDKFGVGDNFDFDGLHINIPTNLVKNSDALQLELRVLSKMDRVFPVNIHGDFIQIDIMKSNCAPSVNYYRFSKPLETDHVSRPLGISENKVQLPPLLKGTKVLDVGAGRGIIAARMRDELGCDVYALEPSFERTTAYDDCVEQLGADRVDKLTLQDALKENPIKYRQAFDAVVVFKYNVHWNQKEEFIRALTQVVKPDGAVYITVVERERLEFSSSSRKDLYLVDTLTKNFSFLSFEERQTFHGADLMAICKRPKLHNTTIY